MSRSSILSWSTAYRLAAGLVLFLAGAAAQTFRRPATASPADPGAPRFALMLYEAAVPPDDEPDLTADVKAWLDALRRKGHYVSADNLALSALEVERDTTWIAWLPGQTYGAPMLSAVYVISATDEQEIIVIARSSPHVQHGGRVIVRPVEEI